MKLLTLDYETRSELDVRDTGGVKYAQHASTDLQCIGYKIDDRPTKVWGARPGRVIPNELYDALADERVTIVAHNALFEQAITAWVLAKKYAIGLAGLTPPERWRCTAAKAAACALPRNLENCGLALGMPVEKDMQGRRLMLKHAKPTRAWTKWHDGLVGDEPPKWHRDSQERRRIMSYCATDVTLEYLVDQRLPHLTPYEQRVWILNQEQNLRGVQIDMENVRRVLRMLELENVNLHQRLVEVTRGEVETIGQLEKIKAFCAKHGVKLKTLDKKSIGNTLAELEKVGTTHHAPAREVLEIRQALSKSSTKKYQTIVERVCDDGRVRDLSLYHGASTGREAGTGLQLQNLPKGKIKDTDFVIDEVIADCSLEEIRLLYGNPLEVFSSCVRGMVCATKGHEIFAADYNAIEARVLSWVADDKTALAAWATGADQYVLAAADVLGKSAVDITPDERQFGKTIVLACGFQMGKDRFYKTCIEWGVKGVSKELAASAVDYFRSSRPNVVKLWSNLEKAAIKAVTDNVQVNVNGTKWFTDDGFLWCQLPSGRCLAYYGPSVRHEPAPWGALMPKLYYHGVDSKTKKWKESASYGGLLTENVVQAIARDVAVNAMINLKKHGFKFLFMVHDEVVAEAPSGTFTIEQFRDVLTALPKWAKGLPIAAGGWNGKRYRK